MITNPKLFFYGGLVLGVIVVTGLIYFGGYRAGVTNERLKNEEIIRKAQMSADKRLREIESEYLELYRSIENEEGGTCNNLYELINRLPSPSNR
jgi:hypothetical protein